MLALLSLDDADADVRLAAADALRCLPEAEPCEETAHERLLNCLAPIMFDHSVDDFVWCLGRLHAGSKL